MSFDWWTLALQTVNFAILVWLLHRFLYRPVLRLIDARRGEIDRQYAAAEVAKTAAAAERQTIADERSGIAAERAAALQAAAVEAETAAAARRKLAQNEADALLAATRKALADERDAAQAEIRSRALDLGIAMARRLLDEIPAGLRAEAWLERIEQHLAGMAPAERAALRDGVHGGLRVITATALPDETLAEWRQRLRDVLGNELTIEFSVDAALIAGVDLHFTNAILRFSWQDALAAMQSGLGTDVDAD